MPITLKQLVVTFLLLFGVSLSGWLAIKTLQAPLNRVPSPQTADSYAIDVIGTKMNVLDGTPQDKFFSPLLVHYPEGDKTDITTPHFIIFNNNGEPWHIYANKGQAQNGIAILELWDHVKLTQAAGPQNQEMIMTTTAMTIFPKEQNAVTKQPVALWQPDGTAHSVGLRADLKTGIIQLLSRARGQYQPQPHT